MKNWTSAETALIRNIAQKYTNYGIPLDDLIQQGSLGLLYAYKRYDKTIEIPLLGYAVKWIKGSILDYIVHNYRVVTVVKTKKHKQLFFQLRKTTEELMKSPGLTLSDVADELEVKLEDIQEMDAKLRQVDVSFNRDEDESDSDSYSFPEDYIESEEPDPADLVQECMDMVTKFNATREQVLNLDERSQDIFWQRYYSLKPTPYRVLAERYGISIERVRQIEKQTLQFLRERLRGLHDE